MKRLIVFIEIVILTGLVWPVQAQQDRAYGHGGSIIITSDTTNIDKTNQYIYYYSSNSRWYFSGGGVLKEVTSVSTTSGSVWIDTGGDTILVIAPNGETVIDCDYTAANSASDGTNYWDNLITMTHDPAANAGVSGIYGRINKTDGSNGVYTINGIEGVAGSSYADEAGTFRGVYGRTYTNADATSTMRTAIGGEFSARASYSGGTECVAENGTAFVGTRIWMAPYFTDASFSNINNSHGLWILNETPNNSWAKYIDRAITIDATTYGSAFNYNIYSDCGKYYQYLNGANAGSGVKAGERSTASGDDWMSVIIDDYRTLTSGQTYRAGYFRNNIRSTTPSNPTCEVTGIEGVAGCYIADEAITFRGGHFRTYINADATSTMRTNIGLEASARASYSGGTECVAENGTCFTGARIWMAPYFSSGSVGNVNNFWGLWIYGEHSSQRNADAAIKISDAGGGFTDDIILQSGGTITNGSVNNIDIDGTVNIVGAGGSAEGLTVDGNKTSANLAEITNNNDGTYAAGDSSFGIESDGSIAASGQIYGETEYDCFMFGFDQTTMDADSAFPLENFTGATITIDSTRVTSDLDDQDFTYYYRNRNGGSTTQIDAVTASTDGTAMYYTTDTSPGNATVTNGLEIGFEKPTVAGTNIRVAIYFHYTKQKR